VQSRVESRLRPGDERLRLQRAAQRWPRLDVIVFYVVVGMVAGMAFVGVAAALLK